MSELEIDSRKVRRREPEMDPKLSAVRRKRMLTSSSGSLSETLWEFELGRVAM